jgi:hypothetical protein
LIFAGFPTGKFPGNSYIGSRPVSPERAHRRFPPEAGHCPATSKHTLAGMNIIPAILSFYKEDQNQRLLE